MEDVVGADKEQAIRSLRDRMIEVKTLRSVLYKAKRALPMLTLKSSLVFLGTNDEYFSKASHRPVAHEASVANGRRLETVCVAVCIPST